MKSDEFYFGRRQTVTYDHTGQPSHTYAPLAQRDFLNPQEGDQFVHDAGHDLAVDALFRTLHFHHRYSPFLTVLRSLKMVWDIPGLAQPAPDIVVVRDLADPARVRSEFHVAAEGASPCFVLEVTSDRFSELDRVEKVKIYAAAGVDEYFILDRGSAGPGAETTNSFIGYRLQDNGYHHVPVDDDGLLFSEINQILFAPGTGAESFRLLDGRTRAPIQVDEQTVSTPATTAEARVRARSIADQLDTFLTDTS